MVHARVRGTGAHVVTPGWGREGRFREQTPLAPGDTATAVLDLRKKAAVGTGAALW